MIDDEKVYSVVCEKIRELRRKHPNTERKITQQELANSIGIERSTLANIELGNQRPPLHIIYALSDYFNIALTDLIPPKEKVLQKKPPSLNVTIGSTDHEVSEKTARLLDKVRSNRKQ